MKAVLATWFSLNLFASAVAGILPPDAIVEGKTIGDWTTQWWKWVLATPTNQNPDLDADGGWAHVNQPEASVFFLGGVPGLASNTVTRTFTVPENKFLLVPLLVVEVDNIDTFPPLTIEQLRDTAAGTVGDPAELHASIDGLPVPDPLQHRALSPLFSLEFTNADNLASLLYGHEITGLDDPMVADGYWLMLEPLPVGPHLLSYGGAYRNPFFFPNDVLARITVVPVPLSQWVDDLLAAVKEADLDGMNLRPLLASLEAARDSFAAHRLQAGIGQLQAFQNKVRAQAAPAAPTLANDLIQFAQLIIDRAKKPLE